MDKKQEPKKFQIKWGKVIAIIAGLIITSLILAKGISLYNKVSSSWEEIKFAYKNTEVVRTVRTDYQDKVKAIEEGYKIKSPTPEQQLIDEVVKQMQSSKTSR